MSRCKENHRGRHDAVTEEQHENTLEARDIHQSTPTSNLAVDDPDITQRIKQFYRDLTALDNVLCSECLKRLPSIQTDAAGICYHCNNDKEVLKLYSAANNMEPGPVPPELCISLHFLMYSRMNCMFSLQSLSQAEERFNSKVLPVMFIY